MASGDTTRVPMVQVELGTSITPIATVTTGRTAINLVLIISNSTSATRLVDIHIRPTADSALPKNRIRASHTAGTNGIEAGRTEIITLGGINIPSQGVIEGRADAAGVGVLCALVEEEN